MAYSFASNFDQFDHLAAVVKEWQADFVQLDRGAFQGELLQAGDPVFGQLSYAHFNRRFDQRGRPPSDWTFAVTVDPATHRNYGQDVPPDAVILFNPEREIDCLSAPGFEVYTLSFPASVIEAAISLTGASDPRTLAGGASFALAEPRIHRALVRRLSRLRRALNRDPARAGTDQFRSELETEIPRLLLESLNPEGEAQWRPPYRQRERAVRRAEEYIQEFARNPITVRELCVAAGVSERTLRYGFLERFGVSPKRYLQALRLHRARQALWRADPEQTQVADIAKHWGFYHLSQFAADYRRLFGELPSQTLRCSPTASSPAMSLAASV